jgi:hypothetical protein
VADAGANIDEVITSAFHHAAAQNVSLELVISKPRGSIQVLAALAAGLRPRRHMAERRFDRYRSAARSLVANSHGMLTLRLPGTSLPRQRRMGPGACPACPETVDEPCCARPDARQRTSRPHPPAEIFNPRSCHHRPFTDARAAAI